MNGSNVVKGCQNRLELDMADSARLGGKVRALRRREQLTQVQLAQRLGISPSYLNLIESNRRPLPAMLLIKLAQVFNVDVHAFASDQDAQVVSHLLEAFSDPLFEPYGLTSAEMRELVTVSSPLARAVLALYRAYQSQRDSTESLASKIVAGQEAVSGYDRAQLPSEEVNDLLQKHNNHFPELETAAEELWNAARLEKAQLGAGLARYLEKAHDVQVRIARHNEAQGVLRRFDPAKQSLTLSELLPTRSRAFQMAHQIALLGQHGALDRLSSDPLLTSDESRSLARVTLANYFAGAVLMPYEPFFQAVREERYDIDVLGRRFSVGFEQVCHRLTTLSRPGASGIPFHMIRIDVAGNISKRFSASGIRFARFSGACPKWNIFAAFMTPGMIRIQVSRMPDGIAYFCLARTIQTDAGGYHQPPAVRAIGLGCQVQHGREMVYADGVDLVNLDSATPVGVTCRVCERVDCEQRAFPSLRHRLQVDENVRGVSLYTPLAIPPTAA
jgi:predicted transcriptional regulator/DNA-binding XRE family transcriptional regulator